MRSDNSFAYGMPFITPEDLTVQDSGVLNVTNAEVVSLQIIPLLTLLL